MIMFSCYVILILGNTLKLIFNISNQLAISMPISVELRFKIINNYSPYGMHYNLCK